MNPAFSILFFTTLAGAAQGVLVALAIALLVGVEMAPAFLLGAIVLAEMLLIAGLASSFLHLGRKGRAWRAVLMWRTSWMSREVIVLPAFIGLVALWWLSLWRSAGGSLAWALPLLVVVGAIALWYCTAMIYACLRFIEEWAHPLTVVNFGLIGLASGLTLTAGMASWMGEGALVKLAGTGAVVVTLLAWAARSAALRRNARIKHRSTLQSATGIRSEKLVQKSMGMSAGSFNTREFFHRASAVGLRNVRLGSQLGSFVLPVAFMLAALRFDSGWWWLLALAAQAPGVLADRWFFFAQAKHPQNLYYQVVN